MHHELLYAVGNKYPGETRHGTALSELKADLRAIAEAEFPTQDPYGAGPYEADKCERAIRAAVKLALELEPSEAMLLAVLPDNESEIGHLMALTCTKVYRAMVAQLLREIEE